MANTIIQIKSSGVTGNVPVTLQPGELAINYFDGTLFYGNSLSQPIQFDTVTEPAGLNGEIQFNQSGSFGSSSNLSFDGTNLRTPYLISTNSNGDEGGEILLYKSATNSTIAGSGITIDVYQNKLRFFEQGGSARGYFLDITSGGNSVGTDLTAHAKAAFDLANTLGGGTATDGWARSAANAASSYANSSFSKSNTATVLAQAAFDYANTIVSDTQVDPYARNTANAAFDKANTTSGAVLVTSNVSSVSSGATIAVAIDMANVAYPGGIFTIYQQEAYVLTVTDIWASGSSTKNAYSNLAANIVNTQNVSVTIALTNGTFDIQTGDNITIGSSIITGSNLTSLGITGTGGTYTIPSTLLLANTQTNSSVTVSASLTTNRGVATDNGTTLTNTQATPFAVSSISASFPSATVPYFNKNQTFSWSASVTGTVVSGNVAYTGASSGTLTTTGQTSGTSDSLDSTQTYTVSSSDYRGTGLNGAGTRTIPSTVSRTITAATSYIPLFYKTTGSSSNPNITTSDTYITSSYTLGQGAYSSATESDYLWIAVPGTDSHTFAFTFLSTQVDVVPDVTFTGQTISGQTYNVYGFTNFSEATNIYTTS